LAYRNLAVPIGGVIDRDYTGNVAVILHNCSPSSKFVVTKGDRIAQLILERNYDYRVEEAPVSLLPNTQRGSNGIGSSDRAKK